MNTAIGMQAWRVPCIQHKQINEGRGGRSRRHVEGKETGVVLKVC